MKNEKELIDEIAQRFRFYISYEMESNKEFPDPWDKQAITKRQRDAKSMSEIAVREFKKYLARKNYPRKNE